MAHLHPVKAIAWAHRHKQQPLLEALALYGYPRLKPLIEILMEDKRCR